MYKLALAQFSLNLPEIMKKRIVLCWVFLVDHDRSKNIIDTMFRCLCYLLVFVAGCSGYAATCHR